METKGMPKEVLTELLRTSSDESEKKGDNSSSSSSGSSRFVPKGGPFLLPPQKAKTIMKKKTKERKSPSSVRVVTTPSVINMNPLGSRGSWMLMTSWNCFADTTRSTDCAANSRAFSVSAFVSLITSFRSLNRTTGMTRTRRMRQASPVRISDC